MAASTQISTEVSYSVHMHALKLSDLGLLHQPRRCPHASGECRALRTGQPEGRRYAAFSVTVMRGSSWPARGNVMDGRYGLRPRPIRSTHSLG